MNKRDETALQHLVDSQAAAVPSVRETRAVMVEYLRFRLEKLAMFESLEAGRSLEVSPEFPHMRVRLVDVTCPHCFSRRA